MSKNSNNDSANVHLYRANVGIMLVNADHQIFVAQRSDSRESAWQMPQGGIDDGEAIRDAALRELWEETGVSPDKVSLIAEHSAWIYYDLPPELQRKLWGGNFIGQRQKWFLMSFHGRDEDININHHDQEFSAWRWASPQEILDLIVPFKKDAYTNVLQEFLPLLERIEHTT